MKRFIFAAVALILIMGGSATWTYFSGRPPARPKAVPEPAQSGAGLREPSTHTEWPVAPFEPVSPRPSPPPAVQVVSRPSAPPELSVEEKPAPVRIYQAANYKAEEPKIEPKEEEDFAYAPYGQMIRCQLYFSIDSSDITTPLVGKVSDGLTYNGKPIIPACSLVHGTCQVGRSKDRIVSEGTFTFVLNEPDHAGRELVVRGLVCDQEYNPQFDTWAIDDGHAGISGSVIKTDNLAEVKLFVASFLSGSAQGLKSTATNVFGLTYNNANGRGVGGLPGYVINPTVEGSQAVLDRYAQMIMDSIERDGYFIRVPSGKTFYVYVRQAIDLRKATIAGDSARKRAETEFLEDRKVQEEVTEPRSVRDAAKLQQQGQGEPSGVPAGMSSALGNSQLEQLNQTVQRTQGLLDERSQSLQTQSDKLRQQAVKQP
jgi:hypothetical protein